MMSHISIDVQAVRREIDALLLRYPELADDIWLLSDSLEGQTQLFEILTRLVREERDADSFGAAIRAQEKVLAERRGRFERRQQLNRDFILALLQSAGLPKLTLPEATLSVSTLAPKPVVDDEAQLPDRLCRIRRAPDMLAIRTELQAGAHIPGAHLSNGSTALVIRVK